MKNFKLFGFTLIVAIVLSVLAQLSGLDQIANSAIGRSLASGSLAMAFVFIYDMKVSKSLPGGTKESIYSTVELGLHGYGVAVATAILVSCFTF